jgi:hypothetical protein
MAADSDGNGIAAGSEPAAGRDPGIALQLVSAMQSGASTSASMIFQAESPSVLLRLREDPS